MLAHVYCTVQGQELTLALAYVSFHSRFDSIRQQGSMRIGDCDDGRAEGRLSIVDRSMEVLIQKTKMRIDNVATKELLINITANITAT